MKTLYWRLIRVDIMGVILLCFQNRAVWKEYDKMVCHGSKTKDGCGPQRHDAKPSSTGLSVCVSFKTETELYFVLRIVKPAGEVVLHNKIQATVDLYAAVRMRHLSNDYGFGF